MFTAVITTIQAPTESTKELVKKLQKPLIVIGDRKSPANYSLPGAIFYPIDIQKDMSFSVAKLIEENTYARKNIGYLIAMKNKSEVIYETDDDNMPTDTWEERQLSSRCVEAKGDKWVNVMKWFMDGIWPRGLPLEYIRDSSFNFGPLQEDIFPIQQGLVDGDPDVDAVWRMIYGKPSGMFNDVVPVAVAKGQWCPFNSQNTWWFKKAFPLMYIPSYCGMRVADIWRSLIAQRCLWEMGHRILFYSGSMFQERNYHDSLKDFEDEINLYLLNDTIVSILSKLTLGNDLYNNLYDCYMALISEGIFPDEEMYILDAWIDDCKTYSK